MRLGRWKVFHTLRLLWVMLIDVITSYDLFFLSYFMLFIIMLPLYSTVTMGVV